VGGLRRPEAGLEAGSEEPTPGTKPADCFTSKPKQTKKFGLRPIEKAEKNSGFGRLNQKEKYSHINLIINRL